MVIDPNQLFGDRGISPGLCGAYKERNNIWLNSAPLAELVKFQMANMRLILYPIRCEGVLEVGVRTDLM